MGRQGPGRVESGLMTRPSESYSLRGGASESTDPRRRARVSPSPHSHPHLMILSGSQHPQPITEQVRPQEWGVGESLSCGAGCRGSGPVRGRQVLRVDILDPEVTLICSDLCDLFACIYQPSTHKTTLWRISSAWAWLDWSWWSSGCWGFRL